MEAGNLVGEVARMRAARAALAAAASEAEAALVQTRTAHMLPLSLPLPGDDQVYIAECSEMSDSWKIESAE